MSNTRRRRRCPVVCRTADRRRQPRIKCGFHSFGASEGRCCSPRARPSRRPPRPLPQPRARHHVASRARRPPHLAGCGVARARPPALAAMPTRLAEPSAALLALPGCAAARLTEPAARARRCWLKCHRALPSCPGRRPCSLARSAVLLLHHSPPRFVPRSAPARSLWWRAAAPVGPLVLEEERMIAKEREEQAGVELVRFGIMVTAQRRRRDKGQFGILLFSFIFIVFHYYS